MKNIVFVCVENSNRSQMAQAFASIHGQDFNSFSAGSKPSGVINPKAISAMRELGYDLTKHNSTSTDDLPDVVFDYIVTMGCGDTCPYVPAKNRIDWEIPDPKHMNEEEFRAVRDEIEERVINLLKESRGNE